MNNFRKLLLKNIKNKKGVMAIEIVIGVFLLLLLLSFMMDMTMLFWKFATISQINTTVAREGGIQGGYLTSAPEGYPGGNRNYTTIGELRSRLNEQFETAGVSNSEWSLSFDGINSLSENRAAPTRKYDNRESFTTQIKIRYKWNMISSFIPGLIEQELTSKRPAMSEWKYDYNSWIGE